MEKIHFIVNCGYAWIDRYVGLKTSVGIPAEEVEIYDVYNWFGGIKLIPLCHMQYCLKFKWNTWSAVSIMDFSMFQLSKCLRNLKMLSDSEKSVGVDEMLPLCLCVIWGVISLSSFLSHRILLQRNPCKRSIWLDLLRLPPLSLNTHGKSLFMLC